MSTMTLHLLKQTSLFFFIVSISACQRSSAPIPLLQPKEIQHEIEKRASYPQETRNDHLPQQILYLMQTQEVAQAIEKYFLYCNELGSQDFTLLQQMSLLQFHPLQHRDKPQQLIATLYGASIAQCASLLPLFEQAIKMEHHPILQLIAVNCLSQMQSDQADALIHRAMASNYLDVVFEAAYCLAEKQKQELLDQIVALMQKVETPLRYLFPQLFSLLASPKATRILQQNLYDRDPKVAVEAIVQTGFGHHDTLAPDIAALLSYHQVAVQESAATTLAQLGSSRARDTLQKLSQASDLYVRLSARHALYKLGQLQQKKALEQEALATKNVFAIFLLGEVAGTQKVLASLLQDRDANVCLNAALALLQHKEAQGLPFLLQILVRDSRDLALEQRYTPGRSFCAWKIVPSASSRIKEMPFLPEQSLRLREQILIQLRQLPEPYFLQVAEVLLEKEQNDLIPMLMQLLKSSPSAACIDLLRKYNQKIGAPLIRNYCALTLLRLDQSGPYRRQLMQWIQERSADELIQFRPFVPQKIASSDQSSMDLTPEENSRLLIEILETLSEERHVEGIDALLHTFADGHAHNRPVIAGLLLRCIQ